MAQSPLPNCVSINQFCTMNRLNSHSDSKKRPKKTRFFREELADYGPDLRRLSAIFARHHANHSAPSIIRR